MTQVHVLGVKTAVQECPDDLIKGRNEISQEWVNCMWWGLGIGNQWQSFRLAAERNREGTFLGVNEEQCFQPNRGLLRRPVLALTARVALRWVLNSAEYWVTCVPWQRKGSICKYKQFVPLSDCRERDSITWNTSQQAHLGYKQILLGWILRGPYIFF